MNKRVPGSLGVNYATPTLTVELRTVVLVVELRTVALVVEPDAAALATLSLAAALARATQFSFAPALPARCQLAQMNASSGLRQARGPKEFQSVLKPRHCPCLQGRQ